MENVSIAKPKTRKSHWKRILTTIQLSERRIRRRHGKGFYGSNGKKGLKPRHIQVYEDPRPTVAEALEGKVFNAGQYVTILSGVHKGENSMVLGSSKIHPGRLAVMTLGGVEHYEVKDIQKQ